MKAKITLLSFFINFTKSFNITSNLPYPPNNNSLQAQFGNDCFICSGTPNSNKGRNGDCKDTQWCIDPFEHQTSPSFKDCEITCSESTPYCYTVKTWTRDKVLLYVDRGCSASNNNFNDFDPSPTNLGKEVCTKSLLSGQETCEFMCDSTLCNFGTITGVSVAVLSINLFFL